MKPYPFKVLHTDVTQVRLANTKWAYVSAITDEASKEVLAFQVSNSPNGKLIMDTLDELSEKNLYKACLIRETVLIMRQLKASFIFLK
ncbi:DDE-type integrase/transposase/recombinase [Pediococcus acidilactici]|uniref:DDE-type integrase/transposase/recombinase n=1 Tax=Pediococcus acidilactici TaxID=1254 RepID=UPI0039C000CB